MIYKLNNSLKKQNGFTLVEVMIALVLFSLILLLLFGNLFTARQYWQIGESSIEKMDEKRLVNQFVRRHVSQALPVVWVDRNKRLLLFKGDEEQLQFISGLPAHRGGGGLYTLTLSVSENDNASSLNLSYALLNPDHEPFTDEVEPKSVMIVENIESFSISYFGINDTSNSPRWHDEWENDKLLPLLVRIQIQQTNQVNFWPEIDIPINQNTVQALPEFLIQKSVTS